MELLKFEVVLSVSIPYRKDNNLHIFLNDPDDLLVSIPYRKDNNFLDGLVDKLSNSCFNSL